MKVKTNRYWFVARYFGRGWYPETWEGWTVSFIYTAAVLLTYFNLTSPRSILLIVIYSVVFCVVCIKKTRQPVVSRDGKEKGWRAGRVG